MFFVEEVNGYPLLLLNISPYSSACVSLHSRGNTSRDCMVEILFISCNDNCMSKQDGRMEDIEEKYG